MKKGKVKGNPRAKKPSGRSAPQSVDQAIDAMYDAVAAFVSAGGGCVVIAGSVEIQEWPGSRMGQFKVAINCLGRKPEQRADEPKAPVARPRAKGSPLLLKRGKKYPQELGKKAPK
jgi:hypothetical protein